MFYHALALLVFGLIADKIQTKLFSWAANLTYLGNRVFFGLNISFIQQKH